MPGATTTWHSALFVMRRASRFGHPGHRLRRDPHRQPTSPPGQGVPPGIEVRRWEWAVLRIVG
ncbi:MAG: hypothetical protein ACRCSN_10095 [Dermatophilaceae bacterium]